MNIIIGAIIVAVGLLLILKTQSILDRLARIYWLKTAIGTEGGSKLSYKLGGLAIIVIGVLTMTGVLNELQMNAKIVMGILIIFVGSMMVIKTEWLLNNFGRLAWFEEKLGTEGGSRLGYKLMGLIAIFFGILMLTGSSGEFLGWALSPLTNAGRQQ